jgi:glycosyltransferase involved in cell wall biosynthesis
MNKNVPIVSIVMATYNRGDLIGESLDSILNQSFRNWECLIIDDGGTDNTQEILKPYLLKDNRFNYYERTKEHKKGLPGCRNQGLELARGEYIIFFDDDDIVHPDNLKICIKEFENSNVDYCRYLRDTFYGDFNLEFDRNQDYKIKLLNIKDLEAIIAGQIPFNSCQVMWKKECFIEARFNESLMYAEEWELYSRILSKGKIGVSIDKVLFFGRKHSNSNTGEFYNNDPVRRASNLMAIQMVLDNLSNKGLLTPILVQYFIRTGFFLKEISIIETVLNYSKAGTLKSLKYLWGFRIYPVLKPIFNMKAKLKKF